MLNFGVLHGWLVDLLYWQVGMSHEQAGKVHVQAGGIHVLNGRLSWQVGRAHGLDEGVAGLAVRGVHLKVRWIHRLDSYSACTSAGSAVSLLPQTVILLGGQGSLSFTLLHFTSLYCIMFVSFNKLSIIRDFTLLYNVCEL